MRHRLLTGCALLAAAGTARAGEAPLYQPAPAWVAPLPPTAVPAAADPSAPALVLFDSQRRFERGRVWSYTDTATRMVSPEMLSGGGTVTASWSPDQGDLVIHRVEIARGPQRIDVLAGGDRFEVLRREQALESRELTGLLTATLVVKGLQVGDVLRVTASVTSADPALHGRAQAAMPLAAAPFRAGFARTRLSWPATETLNWRLYGQGGQPQVTTANGWREVTFALPLPKQPDMPDDAPLRLRRPPMVEATGFASWEEVSRVMAPLFATDGLIAPGSPLDAQAAAIAARTADPRARAEAALELVQDKISYLALGMAGGNYTPQPPARTWELRYGDCKAKTLLLLSLLRRMGVEAEPVLARAQGGDLVADDLPMPAAFDHILVRATVDGKTLWLDGTRSGSRLADIGDSPPFRHVLPLRPAGAALMPVPMHADARADAEVSLNLDESAAMDLPSLFRAEVTVRGPGAATIGAAAAQVTADQRKEMAAKVIGQYVGEAQFYGATVRYDPLAGTAVIGASGLTSMRWDQENKTFRRPLDRAAQYLTFAPDRARPAWRAVPVATGDPGGLLFRTRLRLPDGGRGYVLEGEREVRTTLGGVALSRRASLADGVVTVEERVDGTGAEIAAADVSAERARVAQFKARPLRLVAPADAARRWTAARDPARLKATEAAFAAVIAADPEKASFYESRAGFRADVLNWRGAADDLTRAIALEPSADRYLRRSSIQSALGRDAAALADAQEAAKLEPASTAALARVAWLLAERGDPKTALTMLQERIDVGGDDRFDLMEAKADVQAQTNDTAGAVATLDAAVADKPGDPGLLNARCWLKGTRGVALDTALKDCTKAIELADGTSAALDSRAMVWFRLHRPDDALADLNAALDQDPGQGGSLFMCGVIRRRAGQAKDGDADLALARALSPDIDRTYGRWGIRP